jgi:hypothetical protein
MQQKAFRFGPIALTNAAANLLNPGTTTGGVNSTGSPNANLRILLTHIRVTNKTAASHTVSTYIGATVGSAAGTEFPWNAKAVPANDAVDWYGRLPLDVADFLTGLADANTALTIEGEGEIGVA